jgi:hypothetical protein
MYELKIDQYFIDKKKRKNVISFYHMIDLHVSFLIDHFENNQRTLIYTFFVKKERVKNAYLYDMNK